MTERIMWSHTSEQHMQEMLCSVPPLAWTPRGFLVGEPVDHLSSDGMARYWAFRKIGSEFYKSSRPITILEWREFR